MIVVAQPELAEKESPPDIKKPETQVIEQKTATVVEPEKPKPAPIEEQAVVEAPAPQQVEHPAAETQQSTLAATPMTCEQAIRNTWPQHLQSGAILVSQKENQRQDPVAVGAVNPDKYASRDYGCFQINDHWHPAYFTNGDWRDPEWAAKYALTIYEGRKKVDGIGWTAWYAVQGILW
jgi:hypothetical protein